MLAESIIKAVNEKKIPHEFSLLPKKHITVSIGVATMHASDEISPRKILELVDKSLYKAKEDGRVGSESVWYCETQIKYH